MTIAVAGEKIQLLPERAFYWKAESLLGFSDVHLGKAESLQRHGLPIPTRSHDDDFARLKTLIAKCQPREVVILGDFIHHKDGWSDVLFERISAFIREFSMVHWTLIIGNHERGSRPFLTRLPLRIREGDLKIRDLTLSHGHLETEAGRGFAIEGHLHPVVVLREGPTRLRLPCFVLDEDRLLLPSFGALTGGHEVGPKPQRRLFAMTPQQVFEVKG